MTTPRDQILARIREARWPELERQHIDEGRCHVIRGESVDGYVDMDAAAEAVLAVIERGECL
jgi:hypothetical protein